MADTKISALPALGTAPATDDVFAIVDTDVVATKSVTVANVKTAVEPDAATTSTSGIVELSTDEEAQTGTATNTVLTPANLQAVTGTDERAGVLELSTDEEAQTGTDTARAITPANLQAVTGTDERAGVLELATTDEADTGTDTSRAVTAAGVKSANTGTFDIWIPAAAMRPATTNGCAAITDVEITATQPDLQVLDFDPDTDEFAQFSIAMPKSWDESTITALFFWTNPNAVSTYAVWGIQGVAVAGAATIDVAYGSAQTTTSQFGGTANFLAASSATGAVTIGGSPAAGELTFFQVYRDANNVADTLTTDARLLGVKIIYTTHAITDA